MKNLLLVDFNNLVFRSVFGHKGLTNQGDFTGGIYGFIDMLSTTINRYSCDRVVVCVDNKPYIRSKYYPKYKADRKSSLGKEEEKQVAISKVQIEKFIKRFRIPRAEAKGHEADDLIGEFCRSKVSERYTSIFVMSNDSDLYQLLNGQVFLTKTGGLYGNRSFNMEYPKIRPMDWPRCVALKGSHNGVAGIKGVGDKTAYDAVARTMTNEAVEDKWGVDSETMQLRTALATFPFPLARRPILPVVRKITYSRKEMLKECDRYGITMKKEFHKAFSRLAA